MNTLNAPIIHFTVNQSYLCDRQSSRGNVIQESHYQTLVDELEYAWLKQKIWALLYRIFNLGIFNQLAGKAQRRLAKIQGLLAKYPQQSSMLPEDYTPLMKYLALEVATCELEEWIE